MHAFLKLPRPVDIPDPLESDSPIIPILFVIFFWALQVRNLNYIADIDIPLEPRGAVRRRLRLSKAHPEVLPQTYEVIPKVTCSFARVVQWSVVHRRRNSISS